MKAAQEAKAKITKAAKSTNETLLEVSEDIIKETVKTGEAWQKLLTQAIKKSKPLMEKQGDILFDLAKGLKVEAEYGIKRFEKLTGFDLSDARERVEDLRPKTPNWFKDGFEYVSDQTEEILKEVSKKGEELAENVKETAHTIVKEAEELKDKAEARVKEVIKDVEARITDATPKASAAGKKSGVKTTKKTTGKKTTKAKATAKKTATKKTAAQKTTESKKVAPKATTPKKASVVKTSKTSPSADDLKLIEGVGPKLAEILNEAGYTTYAQMAKANVEDLRKVLDAAGSRYKMHNPTTWPLQASFARDGRFEQLKIWQSNNNAQKS